MIVNTQRLFPKLLSELRIDVVCDVGSMDGVDALAFSAAAPQSQVYAFEPNPHNLRLMQASRALRERNVQIVPLAATNYDGEAEFFLVEAEHSRLDPRRGMSSLHRRSVNGAVGAAVRSIPLAWIAFWPTSVLPEGGSRCGLTPKARHTR